MTHKKPDWRPVFLEALRQVPVVVYACETASVDRSGAYRERRENPEFAQAWDDAIEDGVDRAEREAFRRAREGYEEPVVYKGRLQFVHDEVVDPETGEVRYQRRLDENGKPIPLTLRPHSDQLLTVILKGRRKSVYADRVEHTGGDGGAVQIDETARAARIARLLDLARQRQTQVADDDCSDLV